MPRVQSSRRDSSARDRRTRLSMVPSDLSPEANLDDSPHRKTRSSASKSRTKTSDSVKKTQRPVETVRGFKFAKKRAAEVNSTIVVDLPATESDTSVNVNQPPAVILVEESTALEHSIPIPAPIIKPNPRNIENAARLAQYQKYLAGLEAELAQWEQLKHEAEQANVIGSVSTETLAFATPLPNILTPADREALEGSILLLEPPPIREFLNDVIPQIESMRDIVRTVDRLEKDLDSFTTKTIGFVNAVAFNLLPDRDDPQKIIEQLPSN